MQRDDDSMRKDARRLNEAKRRNAQIFKNVDESRTNTG